MIANPVIKKSGGGQVYSITDSFGFGFPKNAMAGELIKIDKSIYCGIVTLSGEDIPSNVANGTTYFVMPASDVTIS